MARIEVAPDFSFDLDLADVAKLFDLSKLLSSKNVVGLKASASKIQVDLSVEIGGHKATLHEVFKGKFSLDKHGRFESGTVNSFKELVDGAKEPRLYVSDFKLKVDADAKPSPAEAAAKIQGLFKGHDRFIGGDGHDEFNGFGGDDTLLGNGGKDTLKGGGGHDKLDGGSGADKLAGGADNDTYTVDRQGDTVVEKKGEGSDDVVLAKKSYILAAGVEIEKLEADDLNGKKALDLTGNEVSQSVIGSAGDNVLNGGGGKDYMKGLGGHDTFLFATELDSARNMAKIADFDPDNDKFQLDHAIFKGLVGGQSLEGLFETLPSKSTAPEAGIKITYYQNGGVLSFVDETTHTSIQFAHLTNHVALSAEDFLVV